MTTQLEEALKGYPLYSQDGKGKDAICRAIFALGGVRWFILEGEKEGNDTILFGIVIGLMEDEYGYISLNELSEIELDLTRQGFGKNKRGEIALTYISVSYTHLTLPTIRLTCRSRWSPYH